jgi:hypothetical protein
MSDADPKPTAWERLQKAILKPVAEENAKASDDTPQKSLEELVAEEKMADDKERMLGLTAAPLAAGIALIEISNQLTHDKAHAGVYHELLLVLLALAVATLIGAWFRKRMVMAISMALFGLAIFNLHLWGFGVPFLLIGAWMLVRASRAHRAVKDATEGKASSPSSNGVAPAKAKASKRYTPPAAKAKKPPASKPAKNQSDQLAG